MDCFEKHLLVKSETPRQELSFVEILRCSKLYDMINKIKQSIESLEKIWGPKKHERSMAYSVNDNNLGYPSNKNIVRIYT